MPSRTRGREHDRDRLRQRRLRHERLEARHTTSATKAVFLADGNADVTKAIGMELDASGNGLGIRSTATRCWWKTAWSRS